ncbi:MAG: tRNA lysidine(34) synthetase TilS, partial [Gammaproteobacteria bacterium]|nr:tRNA lysidine(34) synthetase TilS [Gammaproteobacteria bacterium]
MSLDASLIERLPDEFPQTRRILIAFSGGLDSRVLLHLAASVRERLTAALRAVHIDHGLQAESGQWAEACRTLCRRLAIPLDVLEANLRPEKGQSVEAEARQHRYALFESLLLPGDLLLLAQHADDQAETVLLQLLRGAGPAGLAAMPRTRRLGAGLLVRPLLDVPRAALEDFARHKGLDWIDDPSNRQHRFDRNYLRHEILPLLEKRFPAYRQTLARSAAHCAESAGMLDELIARDLADCLDARDNSLQLEKLRDLPQTRWKSVIRAWIGANSCRMPQTRQLEQIVRDFLLNLTAS